MHILTYKPEDIPFHLSSFGKFLRTGRNFENLEPHLGMCQALYRKYIHLITPRIIFTTCKITNIDHALMRIDLAGNISFKGKGIYKLLRGSESVIAYCFTLGPALDEEISKVQKSSIYEAFILDAIASTIISGIQDLFIEEVEKLPEAGNTSVTKRFSPGYAGWELKEQRQLYELLEPGTIGVVLTEDHVLLPTKSVTGVYGIYKSNIDSPWQSFIM
ncbi:MAG: vitamin B12 dependent-methionine synthase activation domain-containing protein [Bacteroidota bacterium]|nr:vitamin B12 dependent-methionine synthase activation domain-containing protein [Bacteroidota bacterium]MDP4196257.1 vitamin B12 dependent-methionine synthase activation domain-containing protein [Bacteroidota bacterium]